MIVNTEVSPSLLSCTRTCRVSFDNSPARLLRFAAGRLDSVEDLFLLNAARILCVSSAGTSYAVPLVQLIG